MGQRLDLHPLMNRMSAVTDAQKPWSPPALEPEGAEPAVSATTTLREMIALIDDGEPPVPEVPDIAAIGAQDWRARRAR